MISADLTLAGQLDTGNIKWMDERHINGTIIVESASECYQRCVLGLLDEKAVWV